MFVCEVNVSSVCPFPDDALVPLAVATRRDWQNVADAAGRQWTAGSPSA